MWDLWWTKWHWGSLSPRTSAPPCPFSFHRLLHIRHLPSGAGTIGQIVAHVPSGLSLAPPQEIKKEEKEELFITVVSPECSHTVLLRRFLV
jgi:hypothetical protein